MNTTLNYSKNQLINTRLATKLSNKNEKIGLFLVFMLLAVSGIEYFYRSQYYIIVAFIISGFFFIKANLKFESSLTLIIAIFLIVESFQYATFGGFNLWTFSGSYIRLLLAYFVVQITGKNFPKLYVKVLYFFSIVSLLFYSVSFLPGMSVFYKNILGNLVPPIFKAEGDFYLPIPNIVIFNFEDSLFIDSRNPGPFWEPGAFAVFLIIALLFNQIEEKKLLKKKNIVFTICLITTFSTAGYLAFFIFLIFLNYDLIKRNVLYSFLLFGLITSTLFLYEHIPFLKEKIENNIDIADESTSSRFGSAQADLVYFSKSPFFGMGRAGAKNNFKDDFTHDDHRNNGIFVLLANYGLPFTLFYIFFIYFTFLKIGKLCGFSSAYSIFSILIILILAFSQALFLKPIFNAFLFLPEVFNRYLNAKANMPIKINGN
ncbi:MAG: O-antigen ligase family protein [Sphingobacteriaceae bacterium]|nr:O-antigen ligase family protein [Sphingobacteriaceae bacterium]